MPTVTAPLRTPASGLGEAEAAERRARGEGNAFRPATSRTYWEIFRQNAYLGINGILVGVSLLLVVFGLYVEAMLTAGPVIANILIGVVQETRAKRKLDRIALLNRPRAHVIRDGAERAVDPAEVVLGDLVVARRGDQVLLDGTIVGEGRAELDESLLTGESDAITKVAGDPVLSGSAVVAGTLVFEVERVGAESFANRLLAEARKLGDERTPLQREIAATIWAVAGLVLLTSIPVAIALAVLPGEFSQKQTLTAAAVLVTLVPQGLAIMITVTYAAGALRITRLGALVQRQNAIESMARVDTLCIDKTGTLTTQRISFDRLEAVGSDNAEAIGLVLAMLAASTTAPNRTTEALGAAFPGSARHVDDEIPFASERRWSGLRFRGDVRRRRSADDGAAPGATYVMGAPPVLAPHLAAAPADLDARVEAIASDGVRVLLLARAGNGAALRDAAGHPALPDRLQPIALLGFTEELRSDVQEILGGLARAGLEPQGDLGRRPGDCRGHRAPRRPADGRRRRLRPRPRRPRRRPCLGRGRGGERLRTRRAGPQGAARRPVPRGRALRRDGRRRRERHPVAAPGEPRDRHGIGHRPPPAASPTSSSSAMPSACCPARSSRASGSWRPWRPP